MNRGGSKEDVATQKKKRYKGWWQQEGAPQGLRMASFQRVAEKGDFLVAVSAPQFLSLVLHSDCLNFSRL